MAAVAMAAAVSEAAVTACLTLGRVCRSRAGVSCCPTSNNDNHHQMANMLMFLDRS